MSHAEALKIVALDSPEKAVLLKKTEEIKPDELSLAKEIGQKLFLALQPYFPAAGLAAPQIGISKSVFIFSYDRDPEHLKIAINPTFVPENDTKIVGWEGCLSVDLKLAKVPRYEKIKVSYLNEDGELIKKTLEGFAAKVFQHECDHLIGIVNIDHPNAQVRSFSTKKELGDFLTEVKKEDATRYLKPD